MASLQFMLFPSQPPGYHYKCVSSYALGEQSKACYGLGLTPTLNKLWAEVEGSVSFSRAKQEVQLDQTEMGTSAEVTVG